MVGCVLRLDSFLVSADQQDQQDLHEMLCHGSVSNLMDFQELLKLEGLNNLMYYRGDDNADEMNTKLVLLHLHRTLASIREGVVYQTSHRDDRRYDHQYELCNTIITQKSSAAGGGRNPHDTFFFLLCHLLCISGRPTKGTCCSSTDMHSGWLNL